MKKPVLIIIAGPNGSGKTSVTSQILKHEWTSNSIYINPDEIAQQELGDWNSPQKTLKAAKIATDRRYECLQKKQNLIFETVFSSPEKIEFINIAKEKGYFIRLFFICTNHPSINASRIANRVMQGGHEVPISKIISRFQKAILNCITVSNIVDRLYIYDNTEEYAEAKLLFRKNNGVLIKKYSAIPNWALPIFAKTRS